VLLCADLDADAIAVELEHLGVADDVLEREAPARGVQPVVHRPERLPPGCRLRPLRRGLRQRVYLCQRQVPEGEAQPPVEALSHAPHDRLRGGAVGALEVAVHHELQRRVVWAEDVVVDVQRRDRGHVADGSAARS